MAATNFEGLNGTIAGTGEDAGAVGATSGLGMSAGTAFAGMSLISTLFGAFSQQQAGKAQQRIMQYNADVASAQAADAVERGDVAATRRLTQAQGVIGSQRANLAAQGVDINSGSAAEVQADSAYLGALDAATIKSNAAREAWGYKVQAQDLSARGQIAATTGDNQAISTFLTGSTNLLLAKSGFGRGALSTDPLFTRA